MTDQDWHRHGHFYPERSREYLTALLAELRERLAKVESQKVRVVSAPVTAVDTVSSTFTVTMPTQEDGTSLALAGISAPAQFLPAVGDSVDLQLIGSVPQYQPGGLAPDAVTDREIAPGTKVHVWRQPTQPTAVDVGDVWIDTANGNRESIWGPIGTIVRRNLACNPSFEADAAASPLVPTGWTQVYGGTVGSITSSVTTTTGVTSGTRAAKLVSTGMRNWTSDWMGLTQVVAAAPGDVFRFQVAASWAVTDANHRVEMWWDWLNSSGGTISSGVSSGNTMGSAGSQTLVGTSAAAPAGTVGVRFWAYRIGTLTTGGTTVASADLTLDAVLIEKNRPAGAQTTYFDGDTLSNGDTLWDNPGTKPNCTSTYWQDSIAGANQWYPIKSRTGALEPGSIQASNVIASGTVTATLLEAVLVLASIVIAGDPAGNHATMQSDGFHVFRILTTEGVSEVGLLGNGTSGAFLGFVDGSGTLLAQVDDAGGASFVDLDVDNDPTFRGTPLSRLIANANGGGGDNTPYPGARNFYGWADGSIFNVTSEIGIIEISTYVQSDRMYAVIPQLYYQRSSDATWLQMSIRDGGSSAPSLSSPTVTVDYFMDGPGGAYTLLAERTRLWAPATTGIHRLLLTAAAGGGGHVDITNSVLPTIVLLDLGPNHGNPASVNRGGGGAAPPTQQYYVELAPAGWNTFTGGGGVRHDTTDIVQGWDPSGYNGLGTGLWWFNLPSITGTVDWVQWAVYTNHTYYNSGGTAVWNIVSGGAGWSGGNITNKVGSGGDQYVGGYPKPGWKNWDLPGSWFSQFKNTPPSGARAIGISAGNSGLGTNLGYYCRFDGPSARLRIWYTQ